MNHWYKHRLHFRGKEPKKLYLKYTWERELDHVRASRSLDLGCIMSNLKTGNLQSSTAIQVFQFFTVRIEVGSQKVPPSFHFHQNAIIFAKLKGVMLRLLALYDNKHDISENDRCYYGHAGITLLHLFIPEIHIFSIDEGGNERHTTGGRSRMPAQNIEQQGICWISAYFCKNTIFGCELPALACGFIFQKL